MKKLFNLKNSLISFLTFLLIFSLSIKSYAIEKPTYTKWIRELYDYDESVSDEKIMEEKVFEDETGRVFYKQPSSLTYDTWDGKAGIVAIIEGFNIKNGDGANYYQEDASVLERYFNPANWFTNIDVSQLGIKPNDSNILYYYQIGNPHPYGSSTVDQGGCGPTSFAMIADTLLGTNYGVDYWADWAYSHGYKASSGSYWSLFSQGPSLVGLQSRSISKYDGNSIAAALSAGHPVAMSCRAGGDFTKVGHFIVLTGIDAQGNITVNDPASKKRSSEKWSLSQIMGNGSNKGNYCMWEIWKA